MRSLKVGTVALLAACTSGSNRTPLPSENCLGGVVSASPLVAEVPVGDSVLVTARRLPDIASCYPNATSVFTWSSQEPALVSIRPVRDSTAFVVALGPGTFLVFATLEGGTVPGPLSAPMEMRIR